MSRTFQVTADGGSRGNPGPAAYGATVSENGKVVAELFEFIGTATNNVAEYSGLIAALHYINKLDPAARVEVAEHDGGDRRLARLDLDPGEVDDRHPLVLARGIGDLVDLGAEAAALVREEEGEVVGVGDEERVHRVLLARRP